MKIIKALVLVGRGPDRITLELDLPTPFPVMNYPAYVNIDTEPGYGTEYCRKYFEIEPEVISTRHFK